jgi:hypothetical protein
MCLYQITDETVDTSVFTTFYLGVLTNLERVKAKRETPHFEILFRASYGMDRSQLEIYNENIRMGRWSTKPFDRDDPLKRVCHHHLQLVEQAKYKATIGIIMDISPPSIYGSTVCTVRTTSLRRGDGCWMPENPLFTILRTSLATFRKDFPARRTEMGRRYVHKHHLNPVHC